MLAPCDKFYPSWNSCSSWHSPQTLMWPSLIHPPTPRGGVQASDLPSFQAPLSNKTSTWFLSSLYDGRYCDQTMIDQPNPTNIILACFCAFAHAVPAAWNAHPALVHQINTSANLSQTEGGTPFPVHIWQPQHLLHGTRMSCSQACLQTTECVSPEKRLWLNHFCTQSLTLFLLHIKSQ